ncbi:DoxX family protein [Corynebacterium confusum]|uniref:DoxX family protein n=1 Tax=Corynebacterium confusum TaxID=71254 RepID=UPI0025B3767A|nr:DoxX family protein [Corynebacterium confusum]WJY89592.1 DoxX [Corynebacterium confusum]
MTQNNKPDNARDLGDDFDDVPTYTGPSQSSGQGTARPLKRDDAPETTEFGQTAKPGEKAESAQSGAPSKPAPKRSSLFERAGRAQPQNIEPRAAAAEPEAEDAAGVPAAGNEAETTAFSASGAPAATPAAAADPTVHLDRESRESREPRGTREPRESEAYADRDFAERRSDEPATRYQPAAAPQETMALDPNEPDYAATSQVPAGEQYDADGQLLYAGTTDAADAPDASETTASAKRGTIDFGLLLVRLGLGVYLILAGLRPLLQLGDSAGLSEVTEQFAGYPWANILGVGVPVAQLVAGAFLVLGLLTPVAAMLATLVTGFTALHALAVTGAGLNVFNWPESVWLSVVLFVIALGVQFTGPGVISLDFGRSWARRPLASSWVFIVLGLVALGAIWWFGAGVNPLN